MQAIRAAVHELREVVDFDRQFALARRRVLKNIVAQHGDLRLSALRRAESLRHGRPHDEDQALARSVATLRPEQIRQRIAQVLPESRSVTFVQGPAWGIADILGRNRIRGAKALPPVPPPGASRDP